MKTRLGFVSNSSSSSFIVAFDKMPYSVEELQTIMFGERKEFDHPYHDDLWFKTVEIAETVLSDMKESGPVKKKGVLEAIRKGYFEGKPECLGEEGRKYTIKDENGNERFDWESYEKDCKSAAIIIADKFMKANKGKLLFTFEYGDEDGPYYSALEHGNIFRRLQHLQISCH
jgi:hypothetical protein